MLLSFHVNLSFQPSVDIKTVLSGLMERLSSYAASSIEVRELVPNSESLIS